MRVCLVLSMALWVGCHAWTAAPNPPLDASEGVGSGDEQDALEPRTRESDLAALHLSGSPTISEELSRTIATDLAAVRSQYGTEYPFVLESFYPRWGPGRIILTGLEHTSSDSVEVWGPTVWRQLPERLRPIEVDVFYMLRMLSIQVDDALHPARVADAYEEVLPAGYSVRPSGIVHVAISRSPVAIGRRDRYRLYAFRPSASQRRDLLLVRADRAGQVELVGSGTRDTNAPWVETARSLFQEG